MSSPTTTANSGQVEYWNTSVGQIWAEHQALLDRQIKPLGEIAMKALRLQRGTRGLDIGCGCGQTTLDLSEWTGPTGLVTGVDISRPMLEIARNRPRPSVAGAVKFVEADAQTADLTFGGEPYDFVFSRFGVMFFENPDAAFANIRKALKPKARLSFVCWRSPEENPWMTAPAKVVAHLVPPPAQPQAQDPLAPGPFAFAEASRITGILSRAKFINIDVRPLNMQIGAGGLDDQLILSLQIGPLGAIARAHPELVAEMKGPVRDYIRPFVIDGKVKMPAACWVATANAT